ncbi:MAG: sigma-70 family RNA polymerase sigma factor [Chitinivibrionales bacterium]|nr:sigma-70 family RNA polymerase sigma factor [Chitinivibrionales bacterium]
MAIDVEKMYRTYGPMVLRRCRQLLGSEDRACDAMQEVFVRLIRSREKVTDEYPSSLLYRMATNVSLNMIRSEKRRGEVSDGAEVLERLARADEQTERFEWRNVLARVLRGEPVSTRYMAVLHYVDGLTLEEVAREVSMSVSGVRKRLRVLRAQVRELPEVEECLQSG